MIIQSLQLLDAIDDACLLEDLDDGIIIYANDAALQLLDLDEDELIDSRLDDYLDPVQYPHETSTWKRGTRHFKLKELSLTIDDTRVKQILLSPLPSPIDPQVLTVAHEMSKVLVHRIRSPLNAISGFLEMAQVNNENSESELQAIDDGLQKIKGLLDEIKQFNREFEINEQTVDLHQLLKETTEALPGRWQRKLQVSHEHSIDELITDPRLLKEILLHLLNNAFEASHDELEEVALTVTDQKTIRITNWGTTISKKETGHIFNPFFTTKAKHLGLGLTRAYLIADALGFHLMLTSNSNIDGVTFELQF